jgi:hypothetical protein
MRYWPQKKWKKILLIVFVVLIITSFSTLAVISYLINTDKLTQIEIINPNGEKNAVIFYHPGLSSFAHDVSYTFADGLTLNNWRVEIATPSIEAPTDLSKYDLIVITSNTYGFNPDTPTIRHLERIGDLKGKQTVLITLGAGSAEQSQQVFEDLVKTKNGTIIGTLLLYSMAPNEEGNSATEIAIQVAQQIK